MKNIDKRLCELEKGAAPKLVYLMRIRADGTEVPLKPGQRYAEHVVKMPEVIHDSAEWLKRYAPR